MISSSDNYLIKNRWGFAAIFLGVVVGFVSAFLCIIWHLVIFGFNIMYIISPLMAGFVETIVARKKYGKSTGAISALLTFLLINIYGWFLPGNFVDPTKEPASLSFITIIAILLTFQAAFPILMNYILFVVALGTIRKIAGALIYLPSRLQNTSKEEVQTPISTTEDEDILDELNAPILSIPSIEGRKIIKNIGLVSGAAIAKEKETEGLISKLKSLIEPVNLSDMNLPEARKEAINDMMDNAKSLGANSVVDVLVDYVSMGGLKGSVLILTATGTAVIYEK